MELHVIDDLILPALQDAINHDMNNAKFGLNVPLICWPMKLTSTSII